ncbi:hypothetical protein BJ944DRAFT_239793 [Cunninghamella echinulata]|nr:hypothetical protein BJ944DRAFT_239793 [Cunninghamella echinulata]
MLCSSSIREKYNDAIKIESLLNNIKEDIYGLDSSEVMLLTSSLLTDLNEKPQTGEWDIQTTTQIITLVKYLARRVDGSDILYKYQGVSILLNLAGLTIKEKEELIDTSASQESLKCICNGLLLRNEIKQWLIITEVAQVFIRLLDSNDISNETQFLVCRVLYLITLEDDTADFVKKLVDLNINQCLAKILNNHVNTYIDKPDLWTTASHTEQPIVLIVEGLKLLLSLMETLEEFIIISDTASSSSQSVATTASSIPPAPDNEEVAELFKDCLPALYNIIFILPFPTPLPLISPFIDALRCLTHFTFNVSVIIWRQTETILKRCKKPEDSIYIFTSVFINVLKQTFIYLLPNSSPSPSSLALSFNDHTTTTALSSALSPDQNNNSNNNNKPRLSWQMFSKPTNSDMDIDKELSTVIQILYNSMVVAPHLKKICIYQIIPSSLLSTIPSLSNQNNIDDDKTKEEKEEKVKENENEEVQEIEDEKEKEEKKKEDQSIFDLFCRFVKLTTSTNLPLSKECASELLYYCVDEDPKALVQLIGYSYAYPILSEKEIDHDQLKPFESNDDHPLYLALNQLSDRLKEEQDRETEKLWTLFNQTKLNPI